MLIHVSSFLSKTPVETLSEADASSAYPKVFNRTKRKDHNHRHTKRKQSFLQGHFESSPFIFA